MDEAEVNVRVLAERMAGEGASYSEVESLRRKITRYRGKDGDWFLVDLLRALGVKLERDGEAVALPGPGQDASSLAEAVRRLQAVTQDLQEVVETLQRDQAEPPGERPGKPAAERRP